MTVARFSRLKIGDGLIGTDLGGGILEIAVDDHAQLTAVWAGPVPSSAGTGLEFRVPKIDGDVVTFDLLSLFTRLSSSPSGTVQFTVEKSAGGGAFAATSIGSLTHAAGQYEKEDDALTGTVSSGDLVRINYVNVAGATGGCYEVELTAIQQ